MQLRQPLVWKDALMDFVIRKQRIELSNVITLIVTPSTEKSRSFKGDFITDVVGAEYPQEWLNVEILAGLTAFDVDIATVCLLGKDEVYFVP